MSDENFCYIEICNRILLIRKFTDSKLLKSNFLLNSERGKKSDKSNFGSLAQLAQSAQFYFLISHFNQKSKSVKMCKKNFYTFKF